MNKFSHALKYFTAALLFSAAPHATAVDWDTVDWNGVPGTDVPVFYPGQTGMEWILHKRKHDGAARYRKRKKSCQGCHRGDEGKYGKHQLSIEPDGSPFPGLRPVAIVNVRAAYDSKNFHMRLSWPKNSARNEPIEDSFDSRITVMLDDGGVEEFAWGGCWEVCHQDSTKMPASNNEERKKYLSKSRKMIIQTVGGGEDLKSEAELDKMFQTGEYLEYWQARLTPGKPAHFIDGYILNDRVDNDPITVSGKAYEKGDHWFVEFSRPLAASGRLKELAENKKYNIGLALHEQFADGRHHIVSMEFSLSLGGNAVIKAIKQ